jgi:hypothetical protein
MMLMLLVREGCWKVWVDRGYQEDPYASKQRRK